MAVLISIPAQAIAEPLTSESFDPTLSLTGSCKVSEADSVPDPDCPEGPMPPAPFSNPKSVTTDSYGNIFVASYGQTSSPEGVEGRVDIFDSFGHFLYEEAIPKGPKNIAVDKLGNLYVVDREDEILLYPPSSYEPAVPKSEYGKPFKVVAGASGSFLIGLAVNPLDQHLFANYGFHITEFGSAEEGNPFIENIGEGTLENSHGLGLAIDWSRKRIYASDHGGVVRVFDLEPPHELLETINGSSTPEGKFLSNFLSLAVDESTGHLFVYDGEGSKTIYELTKNGAYLSTIDHSFRYTFGTEIAVDNGEHSRNGGLNSFGRYLYVPSYPSGLGHTFAFGPSETCKPEITAAAASGITDTEAKLEATIAPCHLATTYTFEYTTQQHYEEEGESFVGAQVAGTGELPAEGVPIKVAAALEGLTPGTAYRFRVVATNEKGSSEAEGQFSTYSEIEAPPSCENAALRTGASALLPDCRAYELVTPADTNARAPVGVGRNGTYFATREASPAGGTVSFEIEGGSIPGFEATGSLAGDTYLATRGEDGWQTSSAGPAGAEAESVNPGSNSPDQGYSFWSTGNGVGSAVITEPTTYLHYPDGHSSLIGRGSLGTDPRAVGRLISEEGGHIVFVSGANGPAVQLEPNAPPDGTKAIYDRTIDQETGEEATHVVSLLPGNITPAEGEDAKYLGASFDGQGIAFAIGNTLYLRFDDQETYEVSEGATFEGVADGGRRITYLQGGDLFTYEIGGEEPVQFTSSGNVTPVNVSTDGSAAYFVSPSVLTGESNPVGATPQPGKENLYISREGTVGFVGSVTNRDVEGEFISVETANGLGLWTTAVGPSESGGAAPGRLGADPSRTTPDGNVLLFESRAPLTGYDPEGHAEVYRYDFSRSELQCLSCNPTKSPGNGEASLESIKPTQFDPQPFGPYGYVTNLRADGRRAFFQSTEPLVQADTDGLQDVYEWEAQGVGSCKRPEGCIYLISSGHSHYADYLYAVSDSGDDVFFLSSDLLLPADSDETPSIYDARVEGGFAEATEEECQGEACLLGPTAPPSPPTISSGEIGPSGNVEPSKPHCGKGKRRVTRHGKTRCVKPHHKKHHHKASSERKGAGK
jgi:hypothetical protein